MKLVLTDTAQSDLREIGGYIAADNPRRALSFVREIAKRAADICATPKAFPLVPRYERHGIRRCVHGDYLIFYRVSGDDLLILHVLHSARDYEALLFRD